MHEDLNLVADLALIFISAGIVSIIFRWLKQPLILGYIVAGFLVGPHFGLFPDVTNVAAVEQWSEIGIIFLLFALGLEFSFKKLVAVGSSALITAGTIFLGMFLSGLVVGRALSWTSMESIFLGGMLSMSSTTIIIKAFNDLGLKKQPFTGVVFGTLVVEDLLAILLMVLLSTFAVSQKFAGSEMLFNLLKLAFFLVLWFLVGIYVIPTLLKKAHRFMNDEMLLILSAGLCFGMVILASFAGFSSALGAFIMGSILAETVESERIEKSVKSIKDLFGSIFFVSVGMMVDPRIIIEYWKPILVITLVVMIGISFFATCGVLIAGKNLNCAVRSGLSMAQIGEFAFIIAALGSSLGVMRDFIYPVIVSVSVITTFTTPYFMKGAEPFSLWLSQHLPRKFVDRINANSSTVKSVTRQSDWKKLLKIFFLRMLTYTVMLLAIFLLFTLYIEPFFVEEFSGIGETWLNWISVVLTFVAMAPFLYGLSSNTGKIGMLFEKLWSDKKANRGPLFALILLKAFVAVSFIVALFFTYFPFSGWMFLAVVAGATLFFIQARSSINHFGFVEGRFLENLNQKEELERQRFPITSSVRSKLIGHDIQLKLLEVSPNSSYIGRQLKDIPFRTEYGINIVKISRGERSINIPSAEEYIFPYDKVLTIGTKEQIERFVAMIEEDENQAPQEEENNAEVDSFIVGPKSYLKDKSLMNAWMRESGCMIIGVERADESIMNPSPDFVFREGDKVWMVGDKQACEWYM